MALTQSDMWNNLDTRAILWAVDARVARVERAIGAMAQTALRVEEALRLGMQAVAEVRSIVEQIATEKEVSGINDRLGIIEQKQETVMAAMDDLNTAIDEAVAAMNHAATTIQNASNNNPALEQAATRLKEAAAALESVDPAQVVAQDNPSP